MRVLLVTSAPYPPAEGLGYHTWNLARRLAQRGHHVHIVTRGGFKSRSERIAPNFLLSRVAYAPIYPLHVHLHGVFVNRLVAQVGASYDLINAHTPLPPVVGGLLPMVTSVHSPMRADTAATRGRDLRSWLVRLQTPVSQRIEERLFARSAGITAVAAWVADALAEYGVDRSRVTVTGNGVEDRFFAAPPEESRSPFVLYAGRVDLGKGLEDLVAAARWLADCRPGNPLRFVVAGTGPLLPRIENLAREAGVRDRFDFLGQVGAERRDELARLYRTAAFFVLPSHHEGMSTVMLEAMASAAPVVVTAVGGAREVILDGDNGMLVPPHAPEALAQALVQLWDDPKRRFEMGRRARISVAERFSWDAVTDQYLQSYEDALLRS